MPRPRSNDSRGTPSRSRVQKDRQRRDRAILQLWRDGWTGKKIATHLAITPAIVGNVVHRRGATRRLGRRTISTVGFADAPVEAWQQGLLPKLERSAGDEDSSDTGKRVLVVLCLLLLKPYYDLEDFKKWVRQFTGYDQDITTFVERAEGFLIIDGRLSDDALAALETDDEIGVVELMLMAMVLVGRFRRTAEGEYASAEGVLIHD